MTGTFRGYRVSPEGVNGTLAQVRVQAQDLGEVLDAAWRHAPSGAGGSQVVAAALAGFVESQEADLREISGRLESAPSGVARAVAAYLESDEQMAQDVQRQAGSVDGRSPFDASRFGGATHSSVGTSPALSGPVFDPRRFSSMKNVDEGGSATGRSAIDAG